jgi:hypothetical protein
MVKHNINNTSSTQEPVFFSEYTVSDLQAMIEQAVEKVLSQHNSNMSTTIDPEELLTREEAAKTFKVSVATIDNYRRDGLIVPSRLVGSVRYKRSDLQAAFSGNILNPHKAPKKGKK